MTHLTSPSPLLSLLPHHTKVFFVKIFVTTTIIITTTINISNRMI